MIINREHKVIFIKATKVGGTSFEIALSKFCGPRCIITPISPADEVLRKQVGARGPQNFQRPIWPEFGGRSDLVFVNHIPAEIVRRSIPPQIWDSYKKITIVRNPFDTAISRYFWNGGKPVTMGFDAYLESLGPVLARNQQIAPRTGAAAMDHYLRYENLEQDMAAAGLEQVYDVFKSLRAKGKSRPKKGASMADMYRKYPRAAELVAEHCADEIAAFGYDWK